METASDLVGVAGFEPTASSSRTRTGLASHMGGWLYALVMALVAVGLSWYQRWLFTRSSPHFLPKLRDARPSSATHRTPEATRPRPPGPGGAPRRTNDLAQADAVWLPPVCDGSRSSAGHPG